MPVARFPAEAEIDLHDASTVRGRFVLERDLPGTTPPALFAALTDERLRRRWVRLPGHELSRSHDVRPAGQERVTSRMTIGDRTELVEHRSTFLALDAPHRLQLTYVAIVDHVPRWASLVDQRLDATEAGCRLHWSESFLFSALSGDGYDDVAHLVGGVRLRLNALQALLDDR